MNAAQQPNQTLWYIDTNPNPNVVRLFTDKGYKVTEIKRGPELVATCGQLTGSAGELRVPAAVLLGSLDDLSDNQRTLVKQLAGYGMENFVPMSKSGTLNRDLLQWRTQEQNEGLGHIKIIGFGGKNQQERPLVLFQWGTEDAEKHWADFERALRSPTNLPPQARK